MGCFDGGGLTNEKAYQLGKFARLALRTSQIDYNGRFCMSSAAAATTRAFGIDRGLPFPLADIAAADVILLVGANPADTMPPAMQWFDQGRSRGATHITIDPRRSPTARGSELWEQAAVLADHITGADPAAAYHGSRLATKLRVAGVNVAAMGLKEPERSDDEFVQFSEPRRGSTKSRLHPVGATLLGDVSKVASLTQAFDRRVPLPEERIKLLFDIGAPSPEVGAGELADEAQVCNCNGVSKGQLVACVRDGQRTVGGVMAATRAGKGCGSCKGLVADIVTAALGSDLQVDPAEDYYVPCIPMDKPTLMAEIRQRGLRSPSAVFAALAEDGLEHAGSKMALASLLKMMWGQQYIDERDARFINDRVHANIQRDGTFSVGPQISGGVTTPAQLRRIADVAERYHIPMLRSPVVSASTCSGYAGRPA